MILWISIGTLLSCSIIATDREDINGEVCPKMAAKEMDAPKGTPNPEVPLKKDESISQDLEEDFFSLEHTRFVRAYSSNMCVYNCY